MPAVYSKDVPPPADGMVRLYRAESPTVRFSDVFDVSQLGQFKRPDGMTGDRYTDEFKLADYYRMSYGRDAVILYVDVPKESLAGRGGAAGEFFIDTAISIDRRRTAQAAAMHRVGASTHHREQVVVLCVSSRSRCGRARGASSAAHRRVVFCRAGDVHARRCNPNLRLRSATRAWFVP